MADAEVVPIKEWNERVSYLVHQNIKQAETSTFLLGWMNCETDVWWKIHFWEDINYFSTEISLDAAEQPKYFQTAKINDNWQVHVRTGKQQQNKGVSSKCTLTRLCLPEEASHTVCCTFQLLPYFMQIYLNNLTGLP